jgi:hypothetical protein
MDFYAIAAQVIPVLYLAMAFESRILYRQPGSILREPKDKDDPEYWNVSTPVLTMWVALLMTAGEVAALLGLYHDIEHPIINALIWYGLVAASQVYFGLSGRINCNSTSALLRRPVALA